jgi:hypothetical protein
MQLDGHLHSRLPLPPHLHLDPPHQLLPLPRLQPPAPLHLSQPFLKHPLNPLKLFPLDFILLPKRLEFDGQLLILFLEGLVVLGEQVVV